MCRPVNVMRTACCGPLLRGVRSISHRGTGPTGKERNIEICPNGMLFVVIWYLLHCFYVFLCQSELFHAFSIIKQFPFISLYYSSYVLHVVARSYSECPGGCRAHWCRHRTSFQFGGSADFHMIIVGKKGKIDSFGLI